MIPGQFFYADMKRSFFLLLIYFICSCQPTPREERSHKVSNEIAIAPALVTQKVANDSDDPAIWINRKDPGNSLVVGTDKGDDAGAGALYVFNLRGEIVDTVNNIMRPNNVDIAYDFDFNSERIDIAVCTERYSNSIRVFRLPEMTPIDNGGIPVFEGDSLNAPMGVALYTDHASDRIFAIVGRKYGPQTGYLWQYKLHTDNQSVKGTRVRAFGNFSGKKEIEAIAVDNEQGYVYYADEGVGVRKYYAHPDSSDTELALFAREGFTDDHEGISIYKSSDSTGYLLVSDQQANKFHIYPREGTSNNPHDHPVLKTVLLSTLESDGSEVTSAGLNDTFKQGLFVAMSDDGTFQFYKWEDIAGEDLK